VSIGAAISFDRYSIYDFAVCSASFSCGRAGVRAD